MTELAKTFMLIGILIFLTGAALTFVGKIPGVGKLPGDIFIKKENFSFYFPLTACIILSSIFTLIMQFINRR